MRARVFVAQFLIRLGELIQSLSIMIMKPDDLIEFSKQHYMKDKILDHWSSSELVDRGLYKDEEVLIDTLPVKRGRILVLCMGGGREAIQFAIMGFEVCGTDFIPEIIERTKNMAIKEGLKIDGAVQEISKIDFPENSFDVIWLSASMYSCIPTHKRRLKMMAKIHKILRPDGHFLCSFQTRKYSLSKKNILKKTFAALTLGNLSFEKGDVLFGNMEFIHEFISEEEICDEFKKSGLEIIRIHFPSEEAGKGSAALKKNC